MQNNTRSMSRFTVSFEGLFACCFPGLSNTFFHFRFCVCIDSALEIATKWDKKGSRKFKRKCFQMCFSEKLYLT